MSDELVSGSFPSNRIHNETPEGPGTQSGDQPHLTGPVVQGRVVKKSFIRSVFGGVSASDAQDLGEHIVKNVLIPGVQNLVWDSMQSVTMTLNRTIQMMIFGPGAVNRPSILGQALPSRISPQYVEYGATYRDPSTRPPSPGLRSSSKRLQINDIVLNSRAEAEMVLDMLREVIDNYGQVTVLELYRKLNIPTENNYTLADWGWTQLLTAQVHHIRQGYQLVLPSVEFIGPKR